MAGSVRVSEKFTFERLLFRVTKSKVMSLWATRSFKLINDHAQQEDERLAYVLVFQRGDFLRSRVRHLCETFALKVYELPSRGDYAQAYSALKEEFKQT